MTQGGSKDPPLHSRDPPTTIRRGGRNAISSPHARAADAMTMYEAVSRYVIGKRPAVRVLRRHFLPLACVGPSIGPCRTESAEPDSRSQQLLVTN